MARGYAGAVLKLLGAGEHLLTVSAVTDVTAHFRRITFDAPTLFDGAPFEPGAYLRLWFRDETHPTREHQRAYTLVNSDPAAGSVSLEFVLHDIAGPAQGIDPGPCQIGIAAGGVAPQIG